MPENKNYKPIQIDEENDLIVWGIVTYVINKTVKVLFLVKISSFLQINQ
jgi:hypothetical protein